jgi:hypothetical protein
VHRAFDDGESNTAWVLRNGLMFFVVKCAEKIAEDVVVPRVKAWLIERGIIEADPETVMVAQVQVRQAQIVECDDDD